MLLTLNTGYQHNRCFLRVNYLVYLNYRKLPSYSVVFSFFNSSENFNLFYNRFLETDLGKIYRSIEIFENDTSKYQIFNHYSLQCGLT